MSRIFDKHGYTAYPRTIVNFAEELKNMIDDYSKKKITNDDFEELIKFYVENDSDKLFTGDEINITVQRFLGIKRINVLKNVLSNL